MTKPNNICEFCGRGKTVLRTFNNRAVYAPCDCPEYLASQADLAAREEEKRAEELYERQLKAMRKAHIPARYIGGVVNGKKQQFADDYLSYFADGLFIYGSTGTGKTHFAAYLAQRFIEIGGDIEFRYAPELFREIKASFTSDGNTAKIVNRFCDCELLIIDDLGKEGQTPWTIQTLTEIINQRYANNRPFVITTQYSLSALGKRFEETTNAEDAEAITSRIYESCQLLQIAGPNRRKNEEVIL